MMTFMQATKNQRTAPIFVEQETFDMPWQRSLRADANGWRARKA